jgi:copper chaperone CopZ
MSRVSVMRQLRLFVGGMSCRRCVREVTARLRDVPGVETISANPGDCLVRLSGSMQLADVLAAFTGTTYRPRLDGTRSADSGGTAAGKSAQ